MLPPHTLHKLRRHTKFPSPKTTSAIYLAFRALLVAALCYSALSGCSYNEEASSELRGYIKQSTTDDDLKNIRALIEDNADINIVRNMGKCFTLLHIAVGGGHVKLTEYLLEKGADTDIDFGDDCSGRDLLEMAITGFRGKNPRHVATVKQKVAIIGMLMNEGVSVEIDDLVSVASRGELPLVQLFLANGVKTNFKEDDSPNFIPLHFAASKGHLEVIDALISHGAKVNAKAWGRTALMDATEGGHVAAFKYLIDHGATYTKKGKVEQNILLSAAKGGNVEMIKTILALDVDVSIMDEAGKNALWYAAEYNKVEAARLLLDAGVDPNIIAEGHYIAPDGFLQYDDFNAPGIAERLEHTKVAELFRQRGIASIPMSGPARTIPEKLYYRFKDSPYYTNEECQFSLTEVSDTAGRSGSVGNNGSNSLTTRVTRGAKVNLYSTCKLNNYVHLIIVSKKDEKVDVIINMQTTLPNNGLSIDGSRTEYYFKDLIPDGKIVWLASLEPFTSEKDALVNVSEIQVKDLIVSD
jgi:ankyrin repeat protein